MLDEEGVGMRRKEDGAGVQGNGGEVDQEMTEE